MPRFALPLLNLYIPARKENDLSFVKQQTSLTFPVYTTIKAKRGTRQLCVYSKIRKENCSSHFS
jgi:hypothetical protein